MDCAFCTALLYLVIVLFCFFFAKIRSAEMVYALDQINVTSSDLQKLIDVPTEVCYAIIYRMFCYAVAGIPAFNCIRSRP